MNYLIPGIALHPEPRHEVSLKRSGVTSPGLRAARPSIAVPARPRQLARVLAVLSVRRREAGAPGPGGRPSAGSGVSPIAGGATRGVAFLVDR